MIPFINLCLEFPSFCQTRHFQLSHPTMINSRKFCAVAFLEKVKETHPKKRTKVTIGRPPGSLPGRPSGRQPGRPPGRPPGRQPESPMQRRSGFSGRSVNRPDGSPVFAWSPSESLTMVTACFLSFLVFFFNCLVDRQTDRVTDGGSVSSNGTAF